MSKLQMFFASRRVLFAAWILACVVAVFAVSRLAVFMFAPARTEFSLVPSHDLIRHHSCFSAYASAAELLGSPGAHIYAPENYPRTAPDATRRLPLGEFEQDKYEYPPTFLVAPAALRLVSHDFRTLRAVWFVLTAVVLAAALAFIARWIGGRPGLAMALLVPIWWVAPGHLMTTQFGNVQLVVFALAIAGMVAFDRDRPALGGGLLAFAIGSKLFPGVLALILLLQRRWREALWTAGWGIAYALVIVVLGGTTPFVDFFTDQLPSLLSGKAFAFFLADPAGQASNVSVYGLAFHLEHIGLIGDGAPLARVLGLVYPLVAVGAAVLVARGNPRSAIATSGSEGRAARAIAWMAVLNLAIMQARFLPPYGLLGTPLLLTIWAPRARTFGRAVALFAIPWVLLTVVIPEPLWLYATMNTVAIVVNLALNFAALRDVLRDQPRDATPTLDGAGR